MDLLLLHNPRAAAGRVPKRVLVRAFERAGHHVHYRSLRKRGWKRVLDDAWDVVVAAGGDGAIARIAIALAKRRGAEMPLALIPAGTANNIARALGVPGSLTRMAEELDSARRSRLAIALIKSPWGKERFVESAGVGPMASLMTAGTTTQRSSIVYLRRALLATAQRTLRVRADRRDLSGAYVMAQVLNIPAVGPRLELARDADPTDDAVELLLVGEQQCAEFAAYLGARAAGRRVHCPIDTIRARRIEIGSWPSQGGGQVDDAPWPENRRPKFGTVQIRVEIRIPVLMTHAPRS